MCLFQAFLKTLDVAALAAALLDTEDAKTTVIRKKRHDRGEYAGFSFILFSGLCRSLFVNEYGTIGDTDIVDQQSGAADIQKQLEAK